MVTRSSTLQHPAHGRMFSVRGENNSQIIEGTLDGIEASDSVVIGGKAGKTRQEKELACGVAPPGAEARQASPRPLAGRGEHEAGDRHADRWAMAFRRGEQEPCGGRGGPGPVHRRGLPRSAAAVASSISAIFLSIRGHTDHAHRALITLGRLGFTHWIGLAFHRCRETPDRLNLRRSGCLETELFACPENFPPISLPHTTVLQAAAWYARSLQICWRLPTAAAPSPMRSCEIFGQTTQRRAC